MGSRQLVLAYARWIDRHRRAVIAGSVVVVLVSGLVAAQLRVNADLSYLLPPKADSVQQLRALEKRARVLGTVMVAVQSNDPHARALAATLLHARLSGLVPSNVSSISYDDRVARDFAWTHRWLYVDVADLRAARDSLRREIDDAHLRANPLYVDLDDGPPPRDDDAERLRGKLRDAERAHAEPAELVSKDKRTQLMVLRTAYPAGDLDRDRALLARVDAEMHYVRAFVPSVDIGTAGDVVLTVAEHDAILDGMVLAVVATIILVIAGLFVFYRSTYLVGAVSWTLVVGALVTFAIARESVGYLNLATAFLSSIVIGNGINFGIVLAARYQEARHAGEQGVECLATAIHATLAGTLAAALAAAVAYGSLVLTSFRGFRDFGIVAGVGILPCWISAYVVLPACLAIRAQSTRPEQGGGGLILAALTPRQPVARAVALAAVIVIAGVGTWHYLSSRPFERDFRRLRSSSAAIDAESHWMERIDHAFGQGISGGFVIAVDDRAQTAPLVARLRALDQGRAEKEKLFSHLESLDDIVPVDQRARLALLAEIRELLTDDALDELEPADRADARSLRPPAELVPVTDRDVPEELAWPFTEADGTRGRIILAMPGWGYDNWDADDIVRFARDMRALGLGPHVKIGGSAFVFADMLELVTHDGPIATLAAVIGAVLLVLLFVGAKRHGLITLVCGVAGTLSMLALASLLGLRINFLDFVALPITIGIGIDYAVNLAARDRHDGGVPAQVLLARTGAAVLLCSYTTVVGYGSLLLSRNQGIRSFGTASILGEATCLGAALLFAPALLALTRRKMRTPSTTATTR